MTPRPRAELLRDPSGVHELTLQNGLKAILLRRPDPPLVAVQTWYRVGSREEEKGRTGLAHFLEHLMFKGTASLRRGDIDLVTLRNGGHSNADTSQDRTRYYFTFAADRWERALEIEADRMRGSAFEEHEFQLERGPVLEELRRDLDDPWWRLHEAVEATAYQVHPYHNPVIGWVEEVTRVPREAVLAFYDAWYQPANCTIVCVGEFEPEHAAERVEALFGAIPVRALPTVEVPPEPPQEGERRFELELEVKVPRMLAAFHTVRVRDADDLVLDVVQTILASGKSSRLHDRLVRRDRLAVEVAAWNDARRDPGLFLVMMELQEGVPRERAEFALWEEFARLAAEGPSAAELERAKRMLRASLVYRRATVNGMADLLGTLEVVGGDWRLWLEIEPRLAATTAEAVREVAARYFRRANRTVGWALERPLDAPAKRKLPGDDVHDAEPAPEDDRPEPEILGRAPAHEGVDVALPVHAVTFGNGLRLICLERPGLPIVSVRVHTDAGQLRERLPGTAAFVGECLDEGAGGRTGQEIATVVESLGATLQTGPTGAALRCLTSDVETCLDVLADVVLRPDFPGDVVERKRHELVSHLLAEDDDPAYTGRLRLRAEVYGAHPFARRDKGSAEALAAISAEALREHHAALFVPRNTIVAVVGDLPPERMERLVRDRFGAWEDRPARMPPVPAAPAPGAPREILVREDRDQLHLYFGHLGVRRDDPDYYALLVGDYVLGSGPGFTDRLSRRVRDELGLAYTVWARIARSADLEPGMFSAYVGTSPDLREKAAEAMAQEIRRYVSEELEEHEVEDARRYLLGSFVFGFETTDVTAEQLVQMERLALGFDYPRTFVERVRSVTRAEISAAVRRHVFPDRLVTVAVGRVG